MGRDVFVRGGLIDGAMRGGGIDATVLRRHGCDGPVDCARGGASPPDLDDQARGQHRLHVGQNAEVDMADAAVDAVDD
jgi:hypothetical protein